MRPASQFKNTKHLKLTKLPIHSKLSIQFGHIIRLLQPWHPGIRKLTQDKTTFRIQEAIQVGAGKAQQTIHLDSIENESPIQVFQFVLASKKSPSNQTLETFLRNLFQGTPKLMEAALMTAALMEAALMTAVLMEAALMEATQARDWIRNKRLSSTNQIIKAPKVPNSPHQIRR